MSEFLMPSLGADMESGTLVEWLVKPGDRVRKGDVVAVVETSKGAIEVEIFEDGVVEALHAEADSEVPVGKPLATISGVAAGEDTVPDAAMEAEARPEPASKADREPEPAVPAAAQPVAREAAPARRPATPAADTTLRASPAARRRARDAGLDLSAVAGSGPGAAIVLEDVERALTGTEKPREERATGFDRVEMRRAIAAAMSRSKREIPHYYLATTVDLHAADRWLGDYNREQPPASRLLMAALFIKATSRALARHPDLNGHYDPDGFVAAREVNPGMAIHLRGGGLVAPALLGADSLALPEVMARLQDLVKRARAGGLRGSEVTRATATITALGERGVDTVYGVIHPPQVAMVGIGRVRSRPVAVADALAVRAAVDISLAADHRVCDGHLGALFLNEIDAQLQQPEAL